MILINIMSCLLALIFVFCIVNASKTDSKLDSVLKVSVSDEVSRHDCASILSDLETSLLALTKSVHENTEGFMLLDEIRIEVPQSWRQSCLRDKFVSDQTSHMEAIDIRLTEKTHPVFGTGPWSSQFGQCGVQGESVRLPRASLNQSHSHELTKLFVQMRLGVFDEMGFDDDPVYPAFVSDGDHLVHNQGCNHTQALFCPSSSAYNADLPTKQNVLCNGQSVLSILKSLTNTSSSLIEPTIMYTTRSSSEEHVIIVLDRNMSENLFELTHSALFHLVQRLRPDSMLSIVSVSNVDTVDLPPTIVSNENKVNLHGRIPRRPRKTSDLCLECALKTAKRLSSGPLSSRRSRIVFITSDNFANNNNNTFDLENEMHVVMLRSHLNNDTAKLIDLGSKLYVVEYEELDLAETLSQVQRALLKCIDSQLVLVHTDKMDTRRLESDSRMEERVLEGSFVVERGLDKELVVMAMLREEDEAEGLELVSPDGVTLDLPRFEHRAITFKLNKPINGVWTYRLTLYGPHCSARIEVLAEPSSPSIILRTWHKVYENPSSIVLYASLKRDEVEAVHDAEVMATIKSGQVVKQIRLRDDGRGLPDVMKGDGVYSAYFTEVVADQNVYHVSVSADDKNGRASIPSRLVPLGMHAPLIESNNDDNYGTNDAHYGSDAIRNARSRRCCGSALRSVYTVPTGQFNRLSMTTTLLFDTRPAESFYVRDNLMESVPDSLFPPGRIADFRQLNSSDKLFVTLAWTAPGKDYYSGQAYRYEIRCYTSREALRDSNFEAMSIPVHASLVPMPESAGQEQRCTVGVPWPNEVFYYAIVAFDASGNRGHISNAVAVVIEERVDDKLLNDVHDDDLESQQQPLLAEDHTESVHTRLVLIIAIVLALILVLAVLVLMVALRSRRRRSDKLESSETLAPKHMSSMSSGTLATLSSHQLLCSSSGLQQAEGQQQSSARVISATMDLLLSSSNSTECSTLSSSDNGSNNVFLPPARISFMEDHSVYRDLSRLNDNNEHCVVTVGRTRHESLV